MKKQINVYFTLTSNNVFGVTQNLKKNISASCGKLGFKGSNRSTPHAAQTLAEHLGTYLNNQKMPLEKCWDITLYNWNELPEIINKNNYG